MNEKWGCGVIIIAASCLYEEGGRQGRRKIFRVFFYGLWAGLGSTQKVLLYFFIYLFSVF
ncbi:hypothetical protein HanRHA438_Chr05g0236571 [Helianthus annuus]|nr:hypothetical protein HanRHA438_Chr05g0236571 [Helianthus annuus]